jgi:hypothetical protein
MRQGTASKLLHALQNTTWTLLEDVSAGIGAHDRVLAQCGCGTTKTIRVSDITSGGSFWCNACASRKKGHAEQERRRAAGLFYTNEERIISNIGSDAIKRCLKDPNYACRGIQFCFSSIREFVDYVITTIGPRPTEKHSIDRVNNEGHYAPGNLRWATRSEQNSNQRTRKGATRLRKLCEARPDYSYESIRAFTKQGLSDDEIINRRKNLSGRPATGSGFRHRELRPEEQV